MKAMMRLGNKLAALLMIFAVGSPLFAIPGREPVETKDGLSTDQVVIHVLNRLAFGPRAGDVERVKKMGVKQYIEQQLNPEPGHKPYPRRHSDDADKENEEEQGLDPNPGIENQIGAHDAADGARGPDGRDLASGGGDDVRAGRDQPAQEVEDEIAQVPHRILDVVPEHPQEPHIAEQVSPAAVHEHGSEGCLPAQPAEAATLAAEVHPLPGLRGPCDLSGYHSVAADRLHEALARAGVLHEQPHAYVDCDEDESDVGSELGRVLVAQGEEHAPA